MINKVANRYSKAVYELAVEKKCVDDLIKDMISIRDIYRNSSELNSLVNSPVINSDDKKELLNQTLLSGNSNYNELTKQLINLLLSKKRINMLDDVCFGVINLDKRVNNIVDAKIESVTVLDTNQLKTIKTFLEKEFKKTVNIENLINKELIGGFRILIDDNLIDHSIQTHMANLRKFMISG